MFILLSEIQLALGWMEDALKSGPINKIYNIIRW